MLRRRGTKIQVALTRGRNYHYGWESEFQFHSIFFVSINRETKSAVDNYQLPRCHNFSYSLVSTNETPGVECMGGAVELF